YRQSCAHADLPSLPTRRSSDLASSPDRYSASRRGMSVVGLQSPKRLPLMVFFHRVATWAGSWIVRSRNPPPIEVSTRVPALPMIDRKSTRLNSSHVKISYAVFC